MATIEKTGITAALDELCRALFAEQAIYVSVRYESTPEPMVWIVSIDAPFTNFGAELFLAAVARFGTVAESWRADVKVEHDLVAKYATPPGHGAA